MNHWNHYHALVQVPQTSSLPIELVGLVIAGVSLLIIIWQLKLMERQLVLMKRQDEIIARRSELVARVEYKSGNHQFTFDVQNVGKRGVHNFDWHIWVPEPIGRGLQMNNPSAPSSSSDFDQIIDEQNYLHFKGRFEDSIYPTRAKTFARLTLPVNLTAGEHKFYYQIACEDGVFPEDIEDCPLTVTL